MRMRTFFLIAVVIAAITGGGIYTVVSSSDASGSTSTPKAPATLIGNWHQTDGAEGILMNAEISAGSIQINMQPRDSKSSSVYWMGTFDTDKNSTGLWSTVSKADPDAAAKSLFGSLDKTKEFTYKSGDLSFEFTMMGTTSTVHLSK